MLAYIWRLRVLFSHERKKNIEVNLGLGIDDKGNGPRSGK
jgi:hypothetical protein